VSVRRPWRQQLEEGAEILAVEFLGGHELPQDRAELGAEFGQPLIDELADRLRGIGEHAAIGREARGLHREDEILG
jgi:hypothetical protein